MYSIVSDIAYLFSLYEAHTCNMNILQDDLLAFNTTFNNIFVISWFRWSEIKYQMKTHVQAVSRTVVSNTPHNGDEVILNDRAVISNLYAI